MAKENGGFKTALKKLDSKIAKAKKKIDQMKATIKKANAKWLKGYHASQKAGEQMASISKLGTRKHARLKAIILGWNAESPQQTKIRDERREALQKLQDELAALESERAVLKERETNAVRVDDEIVKQVFDRNAAIVSASAQLREYLDRHVFPRLIINGKLGSQMSFTSSDGKFRVIALVNRKTTIAGNLAEQAAILVQRFFDQFQQPTKLNPKVKVLQDLLQNILVEKTRFQIGETFYRFITMDIDPEVAPELVEAQKLLRQCMRSEKTTAYIRLYQRESITAPWEPVRQS